MRPILMALAASLGLGPSLGCGDDLAADIALHAVVQTTITAGSRVGARCELLDSRGEAAVDEQGEPLADSVEITIHHEHPDSFALDEDGEIIATRAGSAVVRCAAPALNLVDSVTIQIVPAAPHRVFTQLEATTTTAGETVGVGCVAFDVFDNETFGFPRTIAASPGGAGVTTDSSSITATLVGDYEVTCVVMGAAEVEGDFLQVLPALPASLSVGLSPERDFYAIDQQVTVVPAARDQFGNRVEEATFAFSASPSIPSPSPGRFHFDADGSYSLSVSVTSPTLDDIPLAASVPIFVNTSGPTIECMRADSPAVAADAYMLDQAPNTTILIPVRVADDFAISSVTIGSSTATYDPQTGNYRGDVPVQFGVNFVDVVAEDEFGVQNSKTCFFLAADRWTAEDAPMPGTLGLRLSPRAIMGGSPTALDSLNDILHVILNSQGLLDIVDQALQDANPLAEQWCFGTARINYTGGLAVSAASTSTELINNGLRVVLSIGELRFNARLGGGCCTTTNGTIRIRNIVATVNVGLRLENGVLRAAISGTPSVSVGSVDTNFGGTCGWLVNLLDLSGTVAGALRDFIASEVGPMLDGVVSSIDVNTLGQSFLVPRLDGSGSIELGFGLALSSLSTTTTRFLLGIGTRFTATVAGHNRPSLGVARRTIGTLLDPPGTTTTRPVGLSLYEGLLNQVLHGLWRGGYFQASLELGEGSASIDARLPPVAIVTSGNRAQLMLGGVRAVVQIPGMIDDPLAITFGGRASASVVLGQDSLSFGSLTLDSLFVSFEGSLEQDQRNALEDLLRTVLQSVLADAINDGLPAIPIPAFTLPASATALGLPGGAELGLVNYLLATGDFHYVLTGAFGVRD